MKKLLKKIKKQKAKEKENADLFDKMDDIVTSQFCMGKVAAFSFVEKQIKQVLKAESSKQLTNRDDSHD